MKNYIGLDLHSKSCTYVVMTEDGELTHEGKFSTSEKTLRIFLDEIKGSKYLMFEETGMAQWAWDVTREKVDKVVVCNPTYLPKKSGPKNDYKDAHHLCMQLRAGNYTEVYHEKSNIMDLRIAVKYYENLVSRLVGLKNNYKALLRNENIEVPSKWIISRNKEHCSRISNPIKRKIAESLFDELNKLEILKTEYEKEFKKNAFSIPIVDKLKSVPGIGPVRSHVIAAYICSAHRFENKHKLWAYAKLVLHTDESDGKFIAKRSPHGRSELKNAFMGAAVCVITNPKQSSVKKYYDYLVEEKKIDKRKARKALARKIAAICLGIMKTGENYNDSLIKIDKKQ